MRNRLIGGVLGGMLVAAAGTAGAAPQTASTDVLLAAIGGSRTLFVTTAAGADLNGGTLDLGSSHRGAFVVNVRDANYDHVGYDVTAKLSDLFLVAGTDVDCTTKIEARKVGVSFPVDPQLQNLAALIGGSVNLSGTVSNALASLLDPSGTLGVDLSGAGLDSLTGRELSATADAITAQLEGAVAGAEKVLDGASDLLPVKIRNGNAGAFTNAASYPGCAGSGSDSPTQRLLMSGDASDLGSFVERLAEDLENMVNGVSAETMISDETIDAAAAEAAAAEAVQELEDAVNAELAALGQTPIDLPQTDDVVNEVLKVLVGTLGSVDLLGQTGTGVVVPALEADASDAPASGIYKGRMTVTLVDRPE